MPIPPTQTQRIIEVEPQSYTFNIKAKATYCHVQIPFEAGRFGIATNADIVLPFIVDNDAGCDALKPVLGIDIGDTQYTDRREIIWPFAGPSSICRLLCTIQAFDERSIDPAVLASKECEDMFTWLIITCKAMWEGESNTPASATGYPLLTSDVLVAGRILERYPRMAFRTMDRHGLTTPALVFDIAPRRGPASRELEDCLLKLIRTDKNIATDVWNAAQIAAWLSDRYPDIACELLRPHAGWATNILTSGSGYSSQDRSEEAVLSIVAGMNKCSNFRFQFADHSRRWLEMKQHAKAVEFGERLHSQAVYTEVLSALDCIGAFYSVQQSLNVNTNTMFEITPEFARYLTPTNAVGKAKTTPEKIRERMEDSENDEQKCDSIVSFRKSEDERTPVNFEPNEFYPEYAEVWVDVYHAPLNAQGYYFKLRRIGSRWVIIELRTTWVS